MKKNMLKKQKKLGAFLSKGRLLLAVTNLCFILMLLPAMVFAQQKKITGRITGNSGDPLQASITIKGTQTGTTSDANGDFTIVANVGNKLIITSVEYVSQEITVGKLNAINVVLTKKNNSLDEVVVVVGYGTQKKKDVTGAVARVSSETLLQTASSNVLDQLKGHAAGVDITSVSAVPGGSSQIRIRGNRSMVANTQPNNVTGGSFQSDAGNANQIDAPLLVVDGIPYSGNLNDISPNDIESLDILKDASATAIYGSRGAGGVIIVTTKRGKSGKPTFNYNAYYGSSSVLAELHVFNGKEYAQLNADAAAGNSGTAGAQPWPLSTAEQAALAAGVSTDWQKLIYRNAPITNNNLSINGGNEKSKYSLSIGYFQQGGVIPNQDYKRYTIRSAMDHQINKSIKIGLSTINSLGIQNTPGGSGVTQGLLRITPLASPYNADGSVNLQLLTGGTDNLFNPLTLKTQSASILARNTTLRTFNSLYGEAQLFEGLKYRINVGLDYSTGKGDNYSGPGTFVNSALSQSQSTGSVSNTTAWQYTVENLLFYNKTFHEKHQLGVTALYSFQKQYNQGSYFAGIGIPFNSLLNTNLYQAASVNAGTANSNYVSQRGLVSFMGRVTYSYSNLYSLTATLRRDGSSVLSPGNQYYNYPAFAVAWNVVNQKFMSNINYISNLKLRVGYGIAASQGINPYSTLGLLGSSAYNYGQGTTGQQGGYTIANLPNSSLGWQSTSQYNYGLDFGLFKNRISGSLEIYNQKTKDILLPVSLPPTQGGGTVTQNLGKTKGHGLELSISTVNIKSNNGFSWTTDFNYFYNREEITQLTTPGQKNDIGNGWFVGQPLTVIYDYKKLGIWQTGDPGLTTQTSPVQKPGDIKLQDTNGDGKITPDDRVILGNFQPKFEAGISNTFAFKGFDFTFSIYSKIGMKVVVPYLSGETGGANYTGYNWFLMSRNNMLKVDYWTPTNPTNAFPQPDASGTPQYSSVLAYVDGSFVKVRNINIGYTFPGDVLNKVKINSLRIYASIVNPFVIYSPFVKDGYGPDPEGNGYGGTIKSQGTSDAGTVGRQITVNANNPATRQVIFGLNLNF